MKKLISAILFIAVTTVTIAQSNYEKGVSYFNKRAEGATGLKAQADNIDNAIGFFKKALETDKGESATVYLMRSYYFKGTFVETDKEKRKAVYQLSRTLGDKQTVKYPKSAAVAYWHLSNIAKWSETAGIMKAAKEGIADMLKEMCEKVIELDPKWRDGAGYRMLGVIHFKTPYIPFLLSWPDNDDAIENLEKSLSYNKNNLMGNLWLGKVLYDEGDKDRGIELLEKTANGKASKDTLLEDGKDIKEAKDLLAKYKK